MARRRDSMLALIMATDIAEYRAWMQRSQPPRVNHIFIRFDDNYAEGYFTCSDEERVCREYVWSLNEALERLGYTILWKIWPQYRRFEIQAYKKPEEMLPIREAGSRG